MSDLAASQIAQAIDGLRFQVCVGLMFLQVAVVIGCFMIARAIRSRGRP